MVKILGIDPGLQRTGWGIVQAQGNSLSYVAHGVIKTKSAEHFAPGIIKCIAAISTS
jgi:crossover junction endodeoxyribonuclease RuvC